MNILASVLVGIVALAHINFLVLEMFLWEGPIGRKVFRMNAEKAAMTSVLAKNQGLYNGFLAAGLVWGIALSVEGAVHARSVETFFLGCVVIAAGFGAATVSPRIFLIQGVPALLALAAVWMA